MNKLNSTPCHYMSLFQYLPNRPIHQQLRPYQMFAHYFIGTIIGILLLYFYSSKGGPPYSLDSLQATLATPVSNEKHFSQPTLIFITPWNKIGYKYVQTYIRKFDYISPVWFDMKSLQIDSSLNAFQLSQIQKAIQAHNHSALITPRLYLDINPQQLQLFLQQNQTYLIETIFSTFISYDGIVFDCPYIAYAERYSLQSLWPFIKALRAKFKSQKPTFKFITTIFPPETRKNQNSIIKKLEPLSDKILIQSYSQHHRDYENPVLVPYDWFKDLISSFENNENIMFGLPFYGYHQQPNRIDHVNADILNTLDPLKYSSQYDQEFRECIYVKKGDSANTITYPCPRFIYDRLQLLQMHKFGVFVWEAGQGMDLLFDYF